MRLLSRTLAPARTTGYKQILVPLTADGVSELALDLACRLAADAGATIRAVNVVEVPELLPLDARMEADDAVGHALLQRAHAVAGSYGLGIATETVHARDAASVITRLAGTYDSDLVVIGYASRPRAGATASRMGRTAGHVLRHSSCRVMLVRG
jgi:nucleotide-binding universal stress UspA family protein